MDETHAFNLAKTLFEKAIAIGGEIDVKEVKKKVELKMLDMVDFDVIQKAHDEVISKQRKAEKRQGGQMTTQKSENQLNSQQSIQTIRDYTVIREKFESELIKSVREAMKIGWIPYGGVSYAAAGMSPTGGNSFIQAMVKFHKK